MVPVTGTSPISWLFAHFMVHNLVNIGIFSKTSIKLLRSMDASQTDNKGLVCHIFTYNIYRKQEQLFGFLLCLLPHTLVFVPNHGWRTYTQSVRADTGYFFTLVAWLCRPHTDLHSGSPYLYEKSTYYYYFLNIGHCNHARVLLFLSVTTGLHTIILPWRENDTWLKEPLCKRNFVPPPGGQPV